jgi:hypothetical protein
VLAPEGSAVQDVLIEGLAKVTDAIVRDSISTLRNTRPSLAVQSLLQYTADTSDRLIPRPLKPLFAPLLLPYQLSQTISKLTAKTPEDEKSLKTLESILSLTNSNVDPTQDRDVLSTTREITAQLIQPNSRLRQLLQDPVIQKKFPVLFSLSRKYSSAVLNRAADRIDEVTNKHSKSGGVKPVKALRRPSSTRGGGNDDRVLNSVGGFASKSARRLADILTPK